MVFNNPLIGDFLNDFFAGHLVLSRYLQQTIDWGSLCGPQIMMARSRSQLGESRRYPSYPHISVGKNVGKK